MRPMMIRGLCMGLGTTVSSALVLTLVMHTTRDMDFGHAFLIHWLLSICAGALAAVALLPVSNQLCRLFVRADN